MHADPHGSPGQPEGTARQASRRTVRRKRRSARDQADLADLIDELVAKRMRARRIDKGLTQQNLADRIGVASQQIHKYERGITRITAGRLSQIAEALDFSVDEFFAYHGAAPMRGKRA